MPNAAVAPTEFRLLGPIEVVRDGQALHLGGRPQRVLLTLLLLEPGQPRSKDWLIDELWQGRPPAGNERTLRVYVSRLRSTLGEDTVSARAPGYVLEVEADRLDARRFERLLHEGRDALARGAAGLAVDRLVAAVALWRGPALADVRDGGVLSLEALRLDELRLVCLEDRIEAKLSLGRHSELDDVRDAAPACAGAAVDRRLRRVRRHPGVVLGERSREVALDRIAIAVGGDAAHAASRSAPLVARADAPASASSLV